MKPIQNVAIGKTDSTELDNPINRKYLTRKMGDYDIYGVSGKCKEITLFLIKDGYETQKIIFRNHSTDTIFLQSVIKSKKPIFDINLDFEILNLENSNDSPSSDPDTTHCNEWTLNKSEIKMIISESRPINGPEWHHLFGHYPCSIQGKILQKSVEFEYSINCGAWFSISSPDTTLMFGSFKEENNKFFIDSAWTEDTLEDSD